MGVFGQWSQGPIQFNSNTGGIEARGTIDQQPPSAAAGPLAAPTAPSSTGGGVLPPAASPQSGPNPEWGLGSPWTGDSAGYGPASSSGSNGGSYGMGGAGISGYGHTSDGSVAFEDGGEVPDEGDGMQDGSVDAPQGAGAATIDPMMAIQRTVQYGRQKMGLPHNFTHGPGSQQAFADGGEVGEDGGVLPDPEQEQQPQAGGGSLPDPRHALMYLTGAGNVSPDIASALEQKLDPQGQMDPSTRTIHTIASAPSPDSAFGLMQHYRTKYNAYSGGARAALDQGNPAQAAVHATQAFSNLPSGYNVQFAPAQGGIAMTAKKLGPQPAQQSAPQTQSFDDGGEVEEDTPQPQDDSQDQGVMPTEVEQSQDTLDQTGSDPQQDGQDISQPVVLTPEQFKKLMQAGYDKPIDDGLPAVLQAIRAAPPDRSGGPDMPVPNVLGNLAKGDFGGAAAAAGRNIKSMFTSPGQAAPDVTAAVTDQDDTPAAAPQGGALGQPKPAQPQGNTPWQPTPSIMAAAQQQRQQAPGGAQVQPSGPQESTAQRGNAGNTRGDREEQTPRPAAADPFAGGDARVGHYQQRIEQLANKLYPNASQGDARNAYIAAQMGKVLESEGKMDQEGAKGRGALDLQRQQGRQTLEQMKELGKNSRQDKSLDQKKQAMQQAIQQKDRNTQINFVRSESNSLRVANPKITPAQITQHLTDTYGINPQLVQMGMSQQGGQGGQQPGGAAPGGGQQSQAPQLKYYNGKLYKRGPNGEAVPVE